MTGPGTFPAALTSLCLRLTTVGIVGVGFIVALLLPQWLSGWSFYLHGGEMAFEAGVFLTFGMLCGLLLGVLSTIAFVPFLYFRRASRSRIVDIATRTAVAVAAFVDFAIVLKVLVADSAGQPGSVMAVVFLSYCLLFAIALLIPRRRKQLTGSLDDFLGEKATRRTVLATGLASAAVIATEAVLKAGTPVAVAARRTLRVSGPNVLLVTFDALSAEDMSVYGYGLPTTPNIGKFAERSSVFTNFYSGSTFTTPSVATMLTGVHPSEHKVYQLSSRLRGACATRTLPRWMRAGGYCTAASISNPYAYFLAQGIESDYDVLPEPPYCTADFMRLWDALGILHRRQPAGSRAEEFWNLKKAWDYIPQHLEMYIGPRFGRTKSEFPPAGSFDQALQVLHQVPEGFFLWVHVFAPHYPYLSGAPSMGRFLQSQEMRSEGAQRSHDFWPVYQPNQQGQVDKLRLRYDEFLLEADSAFGAFLSTLEAGGRLRNTAVIVSADHGESFQGGFCSHESRYQMRPEIHIPLIIHLPGQQNGSRIAITADQTALAPTILEIAGLPRPQGIYGESLVPWLSGANQSAGEGLAFTQYLERDRVFEPVTQGTVGVIDGRNQFVLDLAQGTGVLRNLSEAHLLNVNRSRENPAAVEALRNAIYSRFPNLPRRNA